MKEGGRERGRVGGRAEGAREGEGDSCLNEATEEVVVVGVFQPFRLATAVSGGANA